MRRQFTVHSVSSWLVNQNLQYDQLNAKKSRKRRADRQLWTLSGISCSEFSCYISLLFFFVMIFWTLKRLQQVRKKDKIHFDISRVSFFLNFMFKVEKSGDVKREAMNDPLARVQIAFHSPRLLFRGDFVRVFIFFFFGGSEMINETPEEWL